MVMKSVLRKVCAKAKEHVKHVTLVMFTKCELKLKKHSHIGRNHTFTIQ